MSTFAGPSRLVCIRRRLQFAVVRWRQGDAWNMAKIQRTNAMPGFYYDPLSIKQVKDGFVAVTTIINYISDEGNKKSLLGMTFYDCARRVKQEKSTEQYTQYWGDGGIKLKLGLEEPWGTVKVGTDGMRLMKVACYR